MNTTIDRRVIFQVIEHDLVDDQGLTIHCNNLGN